VIGQGVAVDRYEEHPEACIQKGIDPLGKKPPIGDQPGPKARLTCVCDKAVDRWMQERFPALEVEIPDPPAVEDGQRTRESCAIDPSTLPDEILVVGEGAEVAGGIADVRDRDIAHCRN
jgi:hypothetical protein